MPQKIFQFVKAFLFKVQPSAKSKLLFKFCTWDWSLYGRNVVRIMFRYFVKKSCGVILSVVTSHP